MDAGKFIVLNFWLFVILLTVSSMFERTISIYEKSISCKEATND